MENILHIQTLLSEEDKLFFSNLLAEKLTEAINSFGIYQRESLNFKSTAETCKALSISRPTLRRLRKDGFINGELVGGAYYFSEDEIRRAMSLGLKYKRKDK